MEKIQELIVKYFPTDKLAHFMIGFALGFVLINISGFYGFMFTALILLGKELVYDFVLKKGTFSWEDFFYGIVPVVMLGITKIL